MNIYDEAIVTFHNMHPEYDTANGGTHLLHDKVLDALKRAKIEHELLELYRLEKETKEKYHTSGSLYVMQRILDELREIAEEINLKEKELENMK